MLKILNIKLINRYFLTIYLVALIARGSAFVYLGKPWSLDTVLLSRGVLSDAACAMAFALLLRLTGRLLPLTGLVYGFFALACAANIANIGVNFANLNITDIRFLQEKDFIVKSVGSSEIISLWLFFVICLSAVSFVLSETKARILTASRLWFLYAFAACQILWLPVDAKKPFWHQYNLLEEAIMGIFQRDTRGQFVDSPEVGEKYADFMHLDLSGTPILPLPAKHPKLPNVLMVVIEGLSEQFVEDGIMPNLKKLGDENLHYTNFVFHQRFTENGLYSITCGDLPTLYRQVRIQTAPNGYPIRARLGRKNSPNKWGAVGNRGSASPCLPSVLADHGYQTVFFQASNLRFTNKSGFFQHAGMKQMMGDGILKKNHPLTPQDKAFIGQSFGMPDGIFFPRVTKELSKLNAHKKPWFAMLMTTSTHFPLFVSKQNANKFKSKDQAAFFTADEALGNFVQTLDSQGLLDNTLLIVTGDESGAIFKDDNVASMLAGNWGTLTIRTPDKLQHSSDEYFSQSDIMVSILDYLGWGEQARVGRSVFRDYHHAFRPLMFANIRTDRWYAWHAPDQMASCANYFKICQNLKLQGPLFRTTLEDDTLNKELIDLYIRVARKSDLTNINLTH